MLWGVSGLDCWVGLSPSVYNCMHVRCWCWAAGVAFVVDILLLLSCPKGTWCTFLFQTLCFLGVMVGVGWRASQDRAFVLLVIISSISQTRPIRWLPASPKVQLALLFHTGVAFWPSHSFWFANCCL